MVGWHHRHNGHGFGWTPGVDDDREAWRAEVQSPGVCSPTQKELGMTERLN